MQIPDAENRLVLLLDQPNGSSALMFDAQGGSVHTSPSYIELFQCVKNETGDIDSRNARLNDVLATLGEEGYFLFAMEYPGVPADELGIDGDKMWFDGDEWTVDGWISTDLPIM